MEVEIAAIDSSITKTALAVYSEYIEGTDRNILPSPESRRGDDITSFKLDDQVLHFDMDIG